jgi:AraC-like DNA-binding protein
MVERRKAQLESPFEGVRGTPATGAGLARLAAAIDRFAPRDGGAETAVPGLGLARTEAPNELVHTLYRPALCLVAQGGKDVLLGDERFAYRPSHYLVVSLDLPLTSHVVIASPDAPYLSLRLDIDAGELSALLLATAGGARPRPVATGRGLFLAESEPGLLDAAARLVELLASPGDIAVLAPLIVREMLYRVLRGPDGWRLAQIGVGDGHAQRIARAIGWLKDHFAEPLRIDDIARRVHMSPSSFHEHFKAVTSMSPLQYQKLLRLQEARRLLLSRDIDAATAGHEVGYESPSQFSREYRRLFGAPPGRDLKALRAAS